MQMTVKAECSSCSGTGVYRGFAERQGTGVVCLNCDGTGYKEISYEPFMGRKRRDNITTVYRSRGTFMVTGIGPGGNGIPYEDFFRGKMP
jgi:DnaJ-class molecular chaperone